MYSLWPKSLPIASATTTTKVAKCLKYCANHAKPWAVKCAWTTKDCSACPACTGKCFCAAHIHCRMLTIKPLLLDDLEPPLICLLYTDVRGGRWFCDRFRLWTMVVTHVTSELYTVTWQPPTCRTRVINIDMIFPLKIYLKWLWLRWVVGGENGINEIRR